MALVDNTQDEGPKGGKCQACTEEWVPHEDANIGSLFLCVSIPFMGMEPANVGI